MKFRSENFMNIFYKVGKGRFVLYVEGTSSVRNSQGKLLLKISVFTIGHKLQFFNCHKFILFPDRHHLSESPFQWFDPIRNYVSRAFEKICLNASTTFFAGVSTFREVRFLNFQLKPCADALILGEDC